MNTRNTKYKVEQIIFLFKMSHRLPGKCLFSAYDNNKCLFVCMKEYFVFFNPNITITQYDFYFIFSFPSNRIGTMSIYFMSIEHKICIKCHLTCNISHESTDFFDVCVTRFLIRVHLPNNINEIEQKYE